LKKASKEGLDEGPSGGEVNGVPYEPSAKVRGEQDYIRHNGEGNPGDGWKKGLLLSLGRKKIAKCCGTRVSLENKWGGLEKGGTSR